MKLPQKFIDNMTSLWGEDDFRAYEAALNEPMQHALRVNTSKISVEDFLNISPFELSPIPWCTNGFYYDDKACQPSKHPYYYAGLYYLQEPSATLPAATLPIEAGDKVLDICAAPGGKSTEIFCRLKGKGLLVSNDISASRAKALLKNLEVFGADNILISCESPDVLSKHFGAYFDKIIIDAPCSGEGMFRKSQSMINAWEQNGNELFKNIQISILNEVVKMIKPGGMILYSTCTFAPLEDEESVEYLLSLDPALCLMDFPVDENFVRGRADWGKTDNKDLEKTVHLYPHKVKGEGHYAALIKKRTADEMEEIRRQSKDDNSVPYKAPYSETALCSDICLKRAKLSDEITEFLSHIKKDYDPACFELKNDKLYYIEKGLPEVSGLRVLRFGLLMGEQKKNRFEPSQALAMTLNADLFDNRLLLDLSDERVLKYLKGETLDISDNDKVKDGWVLVCCDGFPLGFGKLKNSTLKNKYLPGWRMM